MLLALNSLNIETNSSDIVTQQFQVRFWFSGTTTQDHLQGSSTVHGRNINEGLEVLQHCIGLDWADCTSWLKETVRLVSIYNSLMELVIMLNIPVSRSAMFLPTTCWTSENILEMQDSMRWRTTTVGHSQRTTEITMGRVSTAQETTAADSGLMFVLMLS